MNLSAYFIEANISLSIVTAFFYLFLKNENSFSFMRSFLLTGIAASLLFPLISFQTTANALPSLSQAITNVLPELIIQETQSSFLNVDFLSIQGVYLIVLLALASRLAIRLLGIVKHWKKSESGKVIDSNHSFSFLGLIFISNSYSKEEQEQIAAHESVHVKQLHSVDILLVELLKIIFWFNPFVYQLKNYFTSIHEFQADEIAVRSVDPNQYCSLLARVALKSADFPIANHFNNSLTLKRIAMITNSKTKLSRWKIASSIAIIGLLFAFISCKEQAKQEENISPSNEVFDTVDEMAMPANGMDGFYQYVANNLSYPASAREKGIEGKVFVQFIVNKDGSISDVSVMKGIGEGCDEAASKVIASSPNWNPAKQGGLIVRQKLVIPINFKLGDGSSSKLSDTNSDFKLLAQVKELSEVVVVGLGTK